MKSVMTAGMKFGKQLTDQNPEMAEMMGFDGSQVQFLVPHCTGEKSLTPAGVDTIFSLKLNDTKGLIDKCRIQEIEIYKKTFLSMRI